MDASRDMAVAAWRGIGADVLRPLGYVRQGQIWRMSDGSLDRLLLLESARGAHALRAHYVHPALDNMSVRRPGWSVYCLPAHLADENHTMGGRDVLEEDLRRHTELGLGFLSWWSTPAEVVVQHLLRTDDPPYHHQAVMPVVGNPRAFTTAVAWAAASADDDLRERSRAALAEVPPSRYRDELVADLDATLKALNGD